MKAKKKEWSLANEIGVLRGIMYAIDMTGVDFDFSEAMYCIDIQQKLKSRDN